MNIDIKEEKARLSIEAEEIQIKLQRNKDEQQKLMQELIKIVGQLELLAKFELTEGVKENETISPMSEE